MSEYQDFLASKALVVPEVGFDPRSLPEFLYPFQREIVTTALRRGRSAIFAECGLGKTPMQLCWAQACIVQTNLPALILAPLAVAKQTVREATKFGLDATYVTGPSIAKLQVSNYERLESLDPKAFGAVVLDESSILKSYSGVTKRRLLESFAATPYRLACSATPAPNDHLELGNHSEFLSVLSSHQMIARWFINDTSSFGTYRLKGHAVEPYWDWVSSWAAMCALPSDIRPDYADAAYVLPELVVTQHVVEVDLIADRREGMLIRVPELSATSVHQERRRTVLERAKRIAEIVRSEPGESWIIWCDTDYEADELRARLPEATEVRGSHSLESKERNLEAFTYGTARVLISKPKIAGFGLNWQHCARMVFAAATFSFESWYQAVRRCWRFGQERPVHVHMVMGATERAVLDVLNRKRDEFERMRAAMLEGARRRQHQKAASGDYLPRRRMKVPAWLRPEGT